MPETAKDHDTLSGTGNSGPALETIHADYGLYGRAAVAMLATAGSISSFSPDNAAVLEAIWPSQHELTFPAQIEGTPSIYDFTADAPALDMADAAARARAAAARLPEDMLDLDF